MVGQLVVILILMAILVGAIVFLHDFVSSHSSAPRTTSSSGVAYNYSCCTVSLPGVPSGSGLYLHVMR